MQRVSVSGRRSSVTFSEEDDEEVFIDIDQLKSEKKALEYAYASPRPNGNDAGAGAGSGDKKKR